ncbi:MAG: pyridoxamine 5'-phosphate oxidase family protein [Hyphomicrobiales bacterium]|nr:pyridoxamine 5'-phosphate oxidase family protein [Hyphomicrobiales bacterium]
MKLKRRQRYGNKKAGASLDLPRPAPFPGSMEKNETIAAPPSFNAETQRAAAASDAKRLLRLARTGTLATLEPDSGAPLVTLVGVASDFDGEPLFLLSTLSRHTRHLARDPRASVLLAQAPERGDPLNHPRVTLSGRMEQADGESPRRRYLQRNPKAKLYAGFADFSFFRLRVENVHFNGGFGRAAPLSAADVLSPRDAEAALAEAEPALLDWVNGKGEEAVAGLAGRRPSGRRLWKAIGLDAEGLDLSAGQSGARLQFASPAPDAAGWRDRVEASSRHETR